MGSIFNIVHICSGISWPHVSALKIAAVEMGRREMRSLFLFLFASHHPLRRDAVIVSDPAKD